MAACCNELDLQLQNDSTQDSVIKDLIGKYKYVFDEKRIAEIRKGNFVYKHFKNKNILYKDSNTSWSVSVYHACYICRKLSYY